uniref:Fibronectin type-III domain-containing protein n=1 Tax=Amphimedon queenslandica TaxID=400682 RepID=A0A1X7SVJ0_AMPQE
MAKGESRSKVIIIIHSVVNRSIVQTDFNPTKAEVITVPPVSIVASIYTLATLTCEGTGNQLNWLVRGGLLSPAIAQQRGITYTDPGIGPGNLSSVLTISAVPNNDGISIGCQIISYQPFQQVFSGATLTIRGVASVENLIMKFNSTSLLITWSPPVYFSNDVPLGSPVSYQVLVTDDEDGAIILDTIIISNTNIAVPNLTDCDSFNISVTALIAQYTSITNTISNNGSNGYAVDIKITNDNFLTPNVTIKVVKQLYLNLIMFHCLSSVKLSSFTIQHFPNYYQ